MQLTATISFVSFILGAFGLPTDHHQPLETTDDGCASAYIFAVRATTESQDPGYGVMGSIVDAVKELVDNCGSEAIVYPAAGIDVTTTPPTVNFQKYRSSETIGINNLTARILSYEEKCPNTAIALLGYSQGAMVVGDVLCGRTSNSPLFPFDPTDPIPSSAVAQVKAIVQFGDPTNIPKLSWRLGTAAWTAVSKFFPRKSVTACEGYGSMWQSYCDLNDVFCTQGFNRQIHLEYVEHYGDVVTKFVADRLNAAIGAVDRDGSMLEL